MNTSIEEYFSRHAEVLQRVAVELAPAIEGAAVLLADALAAGNKILVMGNGGSAADAQHLAAELVGRFLRERRALPAIALTTDSSILTAVGNDYGFDQIFSRQVEALATPGDVVVGISTSGNSVNVQQALMAGRQRGCPTVALLGKGGGTIAGTAELSLVVPAEYTPHIQEAHLTILHILCELVEKRLFPDAG